MGQYFILSAIGRDRPGIVADVAELIYDSGCNLEDSRMTLLGQHFALLVLLSGDGGDLEERLRQECRRLEWDKRLTVFLSPLPTEPSGPPPALAEADYEVRVVGVDRAGIVYRTSQRLAQRGVNILDLETRLEPAPHTGTPMFTMLAQIAVPEGVDGKTLRKDLESLEDELHVEAQLLRPTMTNWKFSSRA